MLKKLAALLIGLAMVIGAPGCGGNPTDSTNTSVSGQPGGPNTGALRVIVTFNAMKEIARAVGKDKAAVTAIVPDGTEPHDFEPKARDLAALSQADIFIYNGLGMEAWAGGAVIAADNPRLVTVEASKGSEAIKNTGSGDTGADMEYDPHLWLSLKGAELEAQNIKDGFIQADPANRAYYEKNCSDFTSRLDKLYNEYKSKFDAVKQKSFVTGHAAFAYLCADFGLEEKSVEGVFAEGEPTARQLAELVKYCKENGVTTIFSEYMVSPGVSQALANEVGAGVKPLYTIEGNEDGLSYLERIEYDLAEIYRSLGHLQ